MFEIKDIQNHLLYTFISFNFKTNRWKWRVVKIVSHNKSVMNIWKTIKFKNKKASWIKRSKLIDYLYSQYPDAIDRSQFHTSFSPPKQVLCLPLDARRDLAPRQSRANKRELRKLSEFVITYRQVPPTIVRTHTQSDVSRV